MGAFAQRNDFGNISRLSNKVLYQAGEDLLKAGNQDSALLYFSVLSGRYSDNMTADDKLLCAKSTNAAGQIYYQKSNYSVAMELFLKGQAISEKEGFEAQLAESYKDIGNVYSSFSDFERSKVLYEKSYSLSKKIGDVDFTNKILNNLVGAYCFSGDVDKATQYYDLLLENKENSARYRYDVLINKSVILAYSGKFNEAATSYRATKEFILANNMDITRLGTVNSCLAMLYKSENKLDSALFFLKENEVEARKANKVDLLTETLKDMASIYEMKGNREKALTYKMAYLDLSDSIFNQQEFNSLKNAQFKYEMDKSGAEINSLREEQRDNEIKIAMQWRILAIVSIGCAIVLALLAIVYRQKRKLRGAYNDLFDRNNANMESERFYKKRLADSESRVKALTEELQKEPEPVAVQESQSSLSQQQREKLIADISRVMDESQEFCDSDFSIDRLATLIGSNTKYVSQVINDEYGKNFRTFLSEYRIKEAMLRLADKERYGNLTIKAIAESVGYKSQANFIAVFTKQTGIKPSIYQKISLERG